MKVDSNWTGTRLIPENEKEEQLLNELWNTLPNDKKRVAAYHNAAIYHLFQKDNPNDRTIFISSGE